MKRPSLNIIFTLITLILVACGDYQDEQSLIYDEPIHSQSLLKKQNENQGTSLKQRGIKERQVEPNETRLSLSQLHGKSTQIIRGRIVDVISDREPYDREAVLPMSRIEIQVLDRFKGKSERTIHIRSFGGTINGVPYFSSIFPRFEKGEEVVLFLADFKGGIFPVGHHQGKMTIIDDTIVETGQSLKEFISDLAKFNNQK